jgi:hypothetical protein
LIVLIWLFEFYFNFFGLIRGIFLGVFERFYQGVSSPLSEKIYVQFLTNTNKLLRESNFLPNFKFKICQKFKISQAKVFNCHLLADFCLANFKFLTDFRFKIR